MKIALVKQDVYQDLYVCDTNSNVEEILFSSQGRVGPIGLFTLYDTDFYIVKEESDKECQIWTKIIPGTKNKFRKLKQETIDKIPGMEFHRPGVDKPNGFFAKSVYEIDWNKYDIVISINISIPTKVVRKYTNVLWCYMIGEANFMMDKVYYGYDISLNQEIRGIFASDNRVIDFPYTFVGPYCLENVVKNYLKRDSYKKGIYAEVNTTKERPVKSVPQFEPISQATGHKINVHKQLIKDNLIQIYDSKYFLKVGGRKTRGNGAIEAISLGTLVLMSPKDIICSQILPKEAWVFDEKEAIEKIKYLDNNPDKYDDLLKKERDLVQQFVIDYPINSLIYYLNKKREYGKPSKVIRYSNLQYLYEILKKVRKKLLK